MFVEVFSDAISSQTYEIWNDAVVRKALTGALSPKYYPTLFDVIDGHHMPYWELNDACDAYGGQGPNRSYFWENSVAKPYNNLPNSALNSILQYGNKPGFDLVALLLQQNHDLRRALCQKNIALAKADNDRQSEQHRYEQEMAALLQKIKRLEEKYCNEKNKRKGKEGLLRRYENRNKSGRTQFNKKRRKLQDKAAARMGKRILKNHKIGPPEKHAGHHKTIKISRVVRHNLTRCLYCNSYDLTPVLYLSKCVLDFDDDKRSILWVRHEGYSKKCPKGHILIPHFPGLQGTSLGPEILRHVLVYCTRRAVDADIVYYFKKFYKVEISENTIWNARKALGLALAPSLQYIIEELKKSEFLQLDESVYRYHKKKIYVWLIRNNIASLIMPLMGRGRKHIYPYVKDLLDKPIVVDGYIVYPLLFKIIQRCWSHILRDALEVCTQNEDNTYYFDLYCKLLAIFHRSKRIAKKTAESGGASMDICNALADEVRAIAAEYGDLKFAGTLYNAADNLFTFLRYPGMPPTNNYSELDVRDWIVPQRNIRRKFMTQGGMTVFGILQSFASTCDKLGLDLGDCLMKILDDPLFNIFEEFERVRAGGLSQLAATPDIPITTEHAQNQLLPMSIKPPIPPNDVMISVQSAPAHPKELSKPVTTPALPAPAAIPSLPLPVTTPALPAPAAIPSLPLPVTTPALPAPYMLVMATVLIQTQTSAIALPRFIRCYSKMNSIVPYAQMVIRYRCHDYLLFQHKSPPFA